MKNSTLWLLFALAVAAAIGGGAAVVESLPPGTYNDIVTAFANAIAVAEGFFIAGSIPNRRNNPGDLESGGVVTTYATADEGWNALYHQVYLMFYGGSAHYNPSMTIAQVAYIYADGKDDPVGAGNWANNVAANLGVTTDTTLQQLMGG